MTKASLLFLLTFFMTGCASQTQLAKVEAHEWTELTCSGFSTWHECRQEARAICPNGFYTADHLENYTIQRREVSVACKS
jgi:hypothetical protein